MFTTRTTTLEIEAIKWIVMMILAMAMMMLLTRIAAG